MGKETSRKNNKEKSNRKEEELEKIEEELEKYKDKEANLEIEVELLKEEMREMRLILGKMKESIKELQAWKEKKEQEETEEEESRKKTTEEPKKEKIDYEKERKEKWIVIRKGEKYRKERGVSEMIEEMIGKKAWIWKSTSSKEVGIIAFKNKEDRNKLWKKRKTILREGEYTIDEYLSEEEKYNRRLMIMEARKLREYGIKVIVENRKMKIDSKWYRMKEGKLNKTIEETEKEDEEGKSGEKK